MAKAFGAENALDIPAMASRRNVATQQVRPVQRLAAAARGMLPRGLRQPARRPRQKRAAPRLFLAEDVQTELLRLEGRINNRLDLAFHGLESSEDPKLRHAALARHLAYATATLDIAVASNPELNLFDMIAFLEISRSALRSYWIPNIFGDRGTALVTALELSTSEAWKIAAQAIGNEEAKRVASFISGWIEKHPDYWAVETFRFSKFSETLRGDLPQADERGIRRLVQHANRALETADLTRLLAERSLHYAQRAPFLIRLQARVATYETLTDGIRTLDSEVSERLSSQIRVVALILAAAFIFRLFRERKALT
jgi:hypothetical protein